MSKSGRFARSMKLPLFLFLLVGSVCHFADARVWPQMEPRWSRCSSAARLQKPIDLLREQPDLRKALESILDQGLPEASISLKEKTVHGARNASYYIASRTDWNAAQKASVYFALATILEGRATVNFRRGWWAKFYPRSDCFVFSGPSHRLVIYVDSAKVFFGKIPEAEQDLIRSRDNIFYAAWNSMPEANHLEEVTDPED